MPHTRLILATYNQTAFLPRVLLGYLRQTNSDYTLVIADDGSRQDQIDLIASYVPRFEDCGVRLEHVWHEDDGWRKNTIMNEAVRRSTDESLLIFSDADCIPSARFIERHAYVHEPWSFHVAGAYRLTEAESEALTEEDVESGAFESLGSDEDKKALLERRRKSIWGTRFRRKNRPKVIGLNMGVDRALFEEINGFDENFTWPYQGEDTDLRDRLMRVRPRPRVKVLYTENEVYHLYHPMKAVGRNDNREYYRLKRPVKCANGLRSL